jgi:hypothetical protein
MIIFSGDDVAYLAWVKSNPDGYVVNVDRAGILPQYPVVHRASHKAISSRLIGNFTTRQYIKFCSKGIRELETYAARVYGRKLKRCTQCMR